MQSKIISSGSYLPEKILTNFDIEKIVETSNEWIVQRTGIHERRVSGECETTVYMATKALENAIKKSNILASNIDAIIVATSTPDVSFPSCALSVACNLGILNCIAFDVQVACTGFVYAMSIADSFIKAGKVKNIAIIGSERMSSIINWKDRNTCVLFGDGAGALILSASEDQNIGILDWNLTSDASLANILTTNEEKFITMNGKNVFKYATEQMSSELMKILEKNNFKSSDLSSVIAHQANLRILSYVAKQTKLNEEIFPITLTKHGNTSAASVPLAFDFWNDSEKIKSGDLIIMQAVGAGMAIGTILIRI